jgi:hypothetical protein
MKKCWRLLFQECIFVRKCSFHCGCSYDFHVCNTYFSNIIRDNVGPSGSAV